MKIDSTSLPALQSPAVLLMKEGAYPNIVDAAYEMDVDVLINDKTFLLGWLGVSDEGHVSEIIASPFFGSLDELEVFCCTYSDCYKKAAILQEKQGACLTLNQWWWAKAEFRENKNNLTWH